MKLGNLNLIVAREDYTVPLALDVSITSYENPFDSEDYLAITAGPGEYFLPTLVEMCASSVTVDLYTEALYPDTNYYRFTLSKNVYMHSYHVREKPFGVTMVFKQAPPEVEANDQSEHEG